ncbi:hypothetical protein [Ensifer sp. SL37]|uniref:hypothetical protein n=1 Tax=Ensifer sp. SL37 TaxID=2995137 RepID=UPI002DD43575|nr:hypothetical protein [Ensifer sp. SL37]
MNQLLDGQPAAPPHFTEKQGQYLAFIWAYSQINERPPAERDLQRYFGAPHHPSTKWCSPSSGPD